MTGRRSFLRNLVAAIVLAPVVAKFAEALPAPFDASQFSDSEWRAVFEFASRPLHPGYEWLADPMPPRFEFRDGAFVRVHAELVPDNHLVVSRSVIAYRATVGVNPLRP